MEPAKYKWAVNPHKLDRAMRFHPGASEEKLLEVYRSYAGAVNEDYVPEFNVPVVAPTVLEAPTMPQDEFKMPEVGQTVIVPPEVVQRVTEASKRTKKA